MIHLVNPSEKGILEHAGDRMPLGLLYIAKSLQGQYVKVFDLNHTDEMDYFSQMNKDRPDMIGISCLTSPMANETKRLLRKMRSYDGNSKLVVGGYHPSIMPEDFRGLANHVVIGEGENLLEKLGNDFIVHNGPTDLKSLGKPDRDLLDSRKYNLDMYGKRTATMITSRGCPNSCVFCGNRDNKVRYSPLHSVFLEVKEIRRNGYDAVYFLDDVFTIQKSRSEIIGEWCKNLDLKFRLTTRANYVEGKNIETLAKDGLDILSMGVESGNSEILERVGKNQTKDQIRNAVNVCTQNGVKTKGFFILGLPGETEKSANETINFAEELREKGMDYFDFYPLVPFPGTSIWTNPDKYGLKIIDRDYSNYLQATKGEPKVVCETKDLKSDKISELLKDAKRRLK